MTDGSESESQAERRFNEILHSRRISHRAQVRYPGARQFRADFKCGPVLVEVDGDLGYDYRKNLDEKRAYCRRAGIPFVAIRCDKVGDPKEVATAIQGIMDGLTNRRQRRLDGGRVRAFQRRLSQSLDEFSKADRSARDSVEARALLKEREVLVERLAAVKAERAKVNQQMAMLERRKAKQSSEASGRLGRTNLRDYLPDPTWSTELVKLEQQKQTLAVTHAEISSRMKELDRRLYDLTQRARLRSS